MRITHPGKELWPSAGITKAAYLAYLNFVADRLLAFSRGRPAMLLRHPRGQACSGFYQKNLPAWAPGWLQTYQECRGGRSTRYLVLSEPADLIWVGNQDALEIHTWLATVDDPEHPDLLVFDLDPAGGAGFAEAVTVAQILRRLLQTLNLVCWVKTSGGSGLHIYVPLQPGPGHQEVRRFAQQVASLLAKSHPELITLERKPDRRGSRVYIDYLQNGRGRTMIAPYSPRATPQATVSTPLDWDELDSVDPLSLTISTVPKRLASLGDPWQEIMRRRGRLPGWEG